MNVTVINEDCLVALRDLPDNSVDSIATDPPYGLSQVNPAKVQDAIVRWATGDREYIPVGRGFMGNSWDAFVPPPAVWDECLRVLKPGGFMAVFAGARTQDLMGMSIRMAGFDIKDGMAWINGQGFPKGLDAEKAVESTLLNGKSNSRTLRKTEQDGDGESYELKGRNNGILGEDRIYDRKRFSSSTEEAAQWSGFKTQIKPAIEPIIVAQKPLDGTVANNLLKWGVGAFNIDACRVGGETRLNSPAGSLENGVNMEGGLAQSGREPAVAVGRYPANVLLDEHAAEAMDEQSGVSVSRANVSSDERKQTMATAAMNPGVGRRDPSNSHNDSGGASRFFPVFRYQAKAPKCERPVIVREDGTKIQHPTVKPLNLMSRSRSVRGVELLSRPQ